MDKALVEEFQKRGCIKGIIPEGGFMGPIELLKEEGRQEGLQKGRCRKDGRKGDRKKRRNLSYKC